MDHKAQNKLFNNLIKKLFHDEDWQERAEAAKQLGFLKDGRATNLLCRALKSDKNPIVKDRIVEAMGRIGDPKATLSVIKTFKEEIGKSDFDKVRIQSIIESLRSLKDKRALVYIGPLLNSDDEKLRNSAINAFDIIEPNWREIVQKKSREKTIQDIFNIKM